MIGSNGIGDILQQDCLTGFGLCHDKAALALANRGKKVNDAGGQVAARMPGEVDFLVREHRGKVVERDTVTDVVRIAAVYLVDLGKREIFLAALGWTDGAIDRVPVFQAEKLDLGKRHVDVVRRSEVVIVGGAQETTIVASDFEHALSHHRAFVLGFSQLCCLLFQQCVKFTLGRDRGGVWGWLRMLSLGTLAVQLAFFILWPQFSFGFFSFNVFGRIAFLLKSIVRIDFLGQDFRIQNRDSRFLSNCRVFAVRGY